MNLDIDGQSNNKLHRFLNFAKNKLLKEGLNKELEHHHYAVLVKGGKIVATGRNQACKNSIVLDYEHFLYPRKKNPNLHAELNCASAIRDIDLSGYKLYVIRVTNGGAVGNSRPCLMCENYLRDRGLKKAYYSINNNTWDEMRLS